MLSPQKDQHTCGVHSLGEAFWKMNSQAKDKVAPTSLLLLKCVMELRPAAGPELKGQSGRVHPLIPSIFSQLLCFSDLGTRAWQGPSLASSILACSLMYIHTNSFCHKGQCLHSAWSGVLSASPSGHVPPPRC